MSSTSTSTSTSSDSVEGSDSTGLTPQETELLDRIRDHEQVDRVVTYEDRSSLHGAMVILDWVTDSTMENGTRIIHEKNYDSHIRNVSSFLDDLDGVRRTRGSKTGLARYTYHIEFTE